MSTWSDTRARGTVLRGGDAAKARSARMDTELRTTAFAPATGVDARLTDPHLQDVVERARRAAVEQGRAQGHAEGYAAGRAAASAEAARRAAAVASQQALADQHRDAQLAGATAVLVAAADAFRSAEALALADVEDVVADLALSIARAVVGRELALAADPGADALARALALAPDGCAVTVRLHPQDAEALGDLPELGAGRELVVVSDPAVEPGGCVAESAGRTVDAQVGPALDRVAAVLRGGQEGAQ